MTGHCLETNCHVKNIQMHLKPKSPEKGKCEHVIEGILKDNFPRNWRDITIMHCQVNYK